MSTVASIRLEYGSSSALVPVPSPRVSWVTTTELDGWRQLAAELSWTEGTTTANYEVDGSTSVLVDWPFARLRARQSGTLRVRVQGVNGWSAWSREQPVVASFLDEGEWQAEFIGPASPTEPAQPALLRHEFEVGAGLKRAIIYATAQGAYQVYANGRPVDDQVLKPGWTPFAQRLVHETTDISALLQPGGNALGVALTAGWYAESYGFNGNERVIYGEQLGFAAQVLLEYDNGRSEWIRTGTDWAVTSEGPWSSAGIYAGEAYDARHVPQGWTEPGFSHTWPAAAVRDAGPIPGPRTGPAVRVTEELPVAEVLTSPSGKTLLDFGQNLVGRLRIRVAGEAATTITLRHAEVLEDGELGVRPLRRAYATDTYTLSGAGVEEWAPSFTFHGFRYAEVSGWPGAFDPAAVTAEVIGSDMVRTGWFECSDPLINRLHENVVWGMRGNFLYVPTDCPQRDERLGWSGDIQVFSPTASYLYDCDGFLASWLVDLALEQSASGSVPFVVPDALDSADTPAAAWGDAATIVPWVLYQRFGDRAVLEAQYPSMTAWVDHVLELAGERRLWEGGFQFGDWLDPDAPPDQPAKAKTDPDLVASAYLFRSLVVVAQTAGVLGIEADASRYRQIAEQVRLAWIAEYVTSAGRLLSDAQTGYAVAIEFGIVTGELVEKMGARLAWLVRRDGYRISTGFVGTPLVTDALTRTGYLSQAGRLLTQTECPSWLYPVTMGATTVWERWDSMLADGSINSGDMTSFNHYALGAIADWLHRVVAGLAPAEPGYKRLEIAPQPLPGLDWATTSHQTPYGPSSVEWRRKDGRIMVGATVPPNTTATVRLPGQEPFVVASGRHEWEVQTGVRQEPRQPVTLGTSLATLMDDPEALAVVIAAVRGVNPCVAEDFARTTMWLPNRPLIDAFSVIATPRIREELEADLAELNAGRR